MKEFPNKIWKHQSIDNVINKIDREGYDCEETW